MKVYYSSLFSLPLFSIKNIFVRSCATFSYDYIRHAKHYLGKGNGMFILNGHIYLKVGCHVNSVFTLPT